MMSDGIRDHEGEYNALAHALVGHTGLSAIHEAMNHMALRAENERLRGALEKIVKRFPCSTVRDMRRVAAETLGVPVPEMNND